MSVRSDAALLRRFRAGDETAFAALHARYAEGIRSYAAYMLRGSAHDPEDAAQDVFLRAYQALRRDDREIDVRPWLFRVAHNRCIDVLRRPLTDDLHAEETAAGEVGAGADPANAIEQREAMRALLKDIGALTDGQRSALLLRELGGLSHEAVGEALGISTTSSRMLVHRARVALTDAAEARDTTCREVRDHVVAASDAGTKLARRDRRHLAGCAECRAFRRAHAGVERELSLLVPFAGSGSGLAALLKVFGGGAASGGGAVAASTTAGGGGLAAKLTVGACCALLAGGGAAVGVKEATDHHHQQRPKTAERRVTRPKPRAVAVTPAPTVTHTATPSPRPAAAKPTTTAHTTPTTAAAPAPTQTVSDSPTAKPPAHEDPRTSVDLSDLSGDPEPPARTTPQQTSTIDLADLGG
jgi:RNA polymerase sigma factor (sigma-70 family)